MRTDRHFVIAALGILMLLAFDARNSSAGLIVLNSSSVIGGSSSFNNDLYDAGPYNAYHVVDNQTGLINEVMGNYWLGSNYQLPEYFVLDLGAAYRILEIDLFNTHNATINDRGTMNFHVHAANSVAFINATVDYDLVGAVQILSDTLTQRNSANDPIAADVYILSLGTDYRYLRFTADSYYGTEGAGLNEIRIFVPEPSTGVLLVAGTTAGWLMRRRRQH